MDAEVLSFSFVLLLLFFFQIEGSVSVTAQLTIGTNFLGFKGRYAVEVRIGHSSNVHYANVTFVQISHFRVTT